MFAFLIMTTAPAFRGTRAPVLIITVSPGAGNKDTEYTPLSLEFTTMKKKIWSMDQ